jgi:hypothetical protein
MAIGPTSLSCLPLQWTISHPKRLVVAVAKGEMRPRALVEFLGALDAAGARPYGKLVFLRRLVTTFSEESVGALANLVRQRERGTPDIVMARSAH